MKHRLLTRGKLAYIHDESFMLAHVGRHVEEKRRSNVSWRHLVFNRFRSERTRARAVMRLYMPLRMLYMYCTRAVAKLLVVVAGDAR